MKRKEFKIQKSKYKSWDKVLSHPQPLQLLSFSTGWVPIPLKGTINPHHSQAGDIPDKILKVPIIFHVIRHKKKGDFLIDAGLDSMYIKDPHGVVGVLIRKIAEKYSLEHSINFHLRENGIRPKLIFLSHTHPDHVAGIRDLTNIPIVISKNEKFAEDRFILLSQYFKNIKEIYDIDFRDANDMELFGPCADLLGDGSLWAIPTPGHTRGHLSFLVNALNNPVLLTADACFIRENFIRGVAPSIYTWDLLEAQKSLEKIIKFVEKYPQVRVGPGHEALE